MARNRNRVVQILMDRDGITADEAKQQIRYCRECIYEAIEMGDVFADDIIEDYLGLEPDYLFDIMF